MRTTIFTSLFAAVAVVSAAAIEQRQTESFLAEIKAWKEISDCQGSTAADLDFNMGNATLNQCAALPYSVATVEVAALIDSAYQVSFYTDAECADLTRGTTVNVPGNCLNNDLGPWAALKITTY
ncbi:hypothetical protein SCAR479_07927 [Seiridium cardinale]|uniref:Uncharacterized protein n=1 Tax=Seiridium cardinale TaxID=138064 RepID=A0ABR2XP17_9PEZI